MGNPERIVVFSDTGTANHVNVFKFCPDFVNATLGNANIKMSAMDLSSAAFPVNTPKFWGDEKVSFMLLWIYILQCTFFVGKWFMCTAVPKCLGWKELVANCIETGWISSEGRLIRHLAFNESFVFAIWYSSCCMGIKSYACPICLVRSSCERIWSETCFKMWPEVWMVCLCAILLFSGQRITNITVSSQLGVR